MLRQGPDETTRAAEATEDRISTEEAATIARLHAEDLARQQAERERLAETTTPEDLATMLGISPEEVRRLAEQARRVESKSSGRVRARPFGVPRVLRSLSLVVVGAAALGAAFTVGRVEGLRKGETRAVPPVGSRPYRLERPSGLVLAPMPRVIPVAPDLVATPPAGTWVRMAARGRVFVVVGPPGSARTLSEAECASLARTARELAAQLRMPLSSSGLARLLSGPFDAPLVDGGTEIGMGNRRVGTNTPVSESFFMENVIRSLNSKH